MSPTRTTSRAPIPTWVCLFTSAVAVIAAWLAFVATLTLFMLDPGRFHLNLWSLALYGLLVLALVTTLARAAREFFAHPQPSPDRKRRP